MTLAYPFFSFQNPLDLYDFSGPKTSGSWKIGNDGVVGGVSETHLSHKHRWDTSVSRERFPRFWGCVRFSEIYLQEFQGT